MTEPLLPQDPAQIGGHRLLARLGAGGMGVVYLGRSRSGGLVALKVVHPGLAADPDFRARFRRETEAARLVHSPWATPVTDAGTEESTPWLATAFVPGPSLAHAVQRFGPLPTSSVRALGRMLAAALREVHAAGIVHRDVKPANVLLAVDGPRLIDFGIARSADQTAITAAGVVAGTPGFLAPEQAEALEDGLGPPCDVFSLGCLLAYAATGRAPFGGGTTEAVLYRTVHDEPDLAGVGADTDDEDGGDGAGLLRMLRACVAKDPSARPTAEDVVSGLAGDAPVEGSWLPDDVTADIADRSVRALAFPDIEPTVVDGPGDGDAVVSPGRRRLLGLTAGAAVLAAGGGGTWWALAGGGGTGGDRRWALGLQADLSGPGKVIGRALERGARLAVEQYDARPDRPFALELRTSDDQGSPERTKAAAERLAHDPGVLAALGPNSTATAVPAAGTYDAELLPVLFVAPGGSDLLTTPCRSALHCRTKDSILAKWAAVYVVNLAGATYTGLLQDRAAELHAADVAGMTSRVLRGEGGEVYPRVIPSGLRDYGPVVEDIVRQGVDAFVYAGYPGGGARVARELAARGFDGLRMGTQALTAPLFTRSAGDAAEGWLLAASFIDTSALPGARAERFRKDFRDRFGEEPDAFAVEAYDVANLTIRELAEGRRNGRPPSRKRLLDRLRHCRYDGIAKKYRFHSDSGEFAGEDTFLYRVENGRLRPMTFPEDKAKDKDREKKKEGE